MVVRWPRWWVATVALLATGCTALREVPPSEYLARPERKHVRVVTRDGLEYEFDYAQVQGDSLVGYRERDVGGVAPEVATIPFAMDDIRSMRIRGVDWYRTSLVGGGLLAALVATGLATGNNNGSGDDGSSSGGGGGRVP